MATTLSQVDLQFQFSDQGPDRGTLRRDYFSALEGHPVASAFRLVPFLAAIDSEHNENIIAIGYSVVVALDDARSVIVRTTVMSLWVEMKARPGRYDAVAESAGPMPDTHRMYPALRRFVEDALGDRLLPPDAEDSVSQIAHSLSEAARNEVARLRAMRYALEEGLAQTSISGSAGSSHTTVVSSLLQLNAVSGRSRDIVREIEREGLWLHLTDSDAYHSYRQLQDSRLLTGLAPATGSTRPWMRKHDSAMRQCAAMKTQLEEETVSLRSLIASAASISNSKEADAQSRFNVIAAIASIGLGLPALVLSLYGASVLLPMDGARLILFLPVIAALLIAAIIAVWQGIVMRHGRVWIVTAIGLLVFVGGLLYVAGLVASQISA